MFILKTFSPTADADYSTTLVPNLLTFPTGAVAGNSQCFDVTTLPDVFVEGTENFFINLASASPLVTISAASQATVNIIDDDCRLLGFAVLHY